MIYEYYKNIFKAWNENVSSNDIYHRILDWTKTYSCKIDNVHVSELLEDILNRMKNNDETNDIVEDFIYGTRYEVIRNYMNKI